MPTSQILPKSVQNTYPDSCVRFLWWFVIISVERRYGWRHPGPVEWITDQLLHTTWILLILVMHHFLLNTQGIKFFKAINIWMFNELRLNSFGLNVHFVWSTFSLSQKILSLSTESDLTITRNQPPENVQFFSVQRSMKSSKMWMGLSKN